MNKPGGMRRWPYVAISILITWEVACKVAPSANAVPLPDAERVTIADVPIGDAAPPLDCVGVLHTVANRGSKVANVERFGAPASAIRTTARLGDLSDSDRRAFGSLPAHERVWPHVL